MRYWLNDYEWRVIKLPNKPRGVPHKVKSSDGTLKFKGVTQRAWLVPPVFLPSVQDERDDESGS